MNEYLVAFIINWFVETLINSNLRDDISFLVAEYVIGV